MSFGLKELQRVKMREDTKTVGLFMNGEMRCKHLAEERDEMNVVREKKVGRAWDYS